MGACGILNKGLQQMMNIWGVWGLWNTPQQKGSPEALPQKIFENTEFYKKDNNNYGFE